MIIILTLSIFFISAISMVLYFNHLATKEQREINNIIKSQRTRSTIKLREEVERVKEPALAEAI